MVARGKGDVDQFCVASSSRKYIDGLPCHGLAGVVRLSEPVAELDNGIGARRAKGHRVGRRPVGEK